MNLKKTDILCFIDEGYALIRKLDKHVNGFVAKNTNKNYVAQSYISVRNELSIALNLLENSIVRAAYDVHTEHAIKQYQTTYKKLETWSK